MKRVVLLALAACAGSAPPPAAPVAETTPPAPPPAAPRATIGTITYAPPAGYAASIDPSGDPPVVYLEKDAPRSLLAVIDATSIYADPCAGWIREYVKGIAAGIAGREIELRVEQEETTPEGCRLVASADVPGDLLFVGVARRVGARAAAIGCIHERSDDAAAAACAALPGGLAAP